jgi:hypothetical protein
MVFSFILAVGALAAPSKPNVVYFLTDDQDQMLGSSFPIHNDVTPMPKTQAKMAEQGTKQPLTSSFIRLFAALAAVNFSPAVTSTTPGYQDDRQGRSCASMSI